MHGTLLVFLKNPQPGQVKTRLAAAIGADRAASLYREWIGQVLRQLQPVRGMVRLVGYFEGGQFETFAAWHDLVDLWRPQPEGHLGTRLEHGFQRAHRDAGPVLAIGTDCLEIDAGLVLDALAALESSDVVLGPAADGGYYLIGTSRHLPGLFDEIRWSSPHASADQLARCRLHGWSTALLAQRGDIDTLEDWEAYLERSTKARD